MGGVNDSAMLATEGAARLNGTRLTDQDIAEGARLAAAQADPPTDIRASARYRQHLLQVYVQKALTDIREESLGIVAQAPHN